MQVFMVGHFLRVQGFLWRFTWRFMGKQRGNVHFLFVEGVLSFMFLRVLFSVLKFFCILFFCFSVGRGNGN